MNDDRDPVVARALRDLPIPDHGPDFWAGLERRLADEAPPARARGAVVVASTLRPQPASGTDDPDADGAGEADTSVVVAMDDRRPARSPRWLVGVAAALVVLVAATVTLRGGDPETERVRIAGPTADDPGAAPTGPPMTTAEPEGSAPGIGATPEAAVLGWLDAVGAGDTARAAALTGPRSKAYADALTGGAGIEGFLREAGEGYGAWADAPDRSTTEVDLDVDGEDVTIVVVSGTWTGEGETAFRTDAIPAVRDADGSWLVEPWAIDPTGGGRLQVLSPTSADGHGFNGLHPDATLSASAPGGGTFHFSLDDQPATAVPGQKAAGGVRATFDPPGAMSSQTHLFVVAYLDGQTLSAVAGTFLVEG